jgi:hypothetical protein
MSGTETRHRAFDVDRPQLPVGAGDREDLLLAVAADLNNGRAGRGVGRPVDGCNSDADDRRYKDLLRGVQVFL